jgi:acyl-coenzyme A synthetase/AMP-(fatty) acid ligase
LYLLLEHPDVRTRNLSSLRHLQLGTAATAPSKVKEAIEVFGPCVSQAYGQIETGFNTALDRALGAAAAAGDHPERLGSAGRSLFVNRVAIMSDDGRLLAPGEHGEIVARGRCIKRYLSDTATAEARRFGWHHTGDIGYIDEEGFLYIVGRLRDVVNMAGMKIPAVEIESVILELPDVRECAVIAVPDRLRGEVPKAIVAARTGAQVSHENIIAHCRRRLGVARAPTSVAEWPDLPKSPAGKIDKLRIRLLDSMHAARVG